VQALRHTGGQKSSCMSTTTNAAFPASVAIMQSRLREVMESCCCVNADVNIVKVVGVRKRQPTNSWIISVARLAHSTLMSEDTSSAKRDTLLELTKCFDGA
jgi:hypothetical protein